MIELTKSFEQEEVAFLHLVQADICEDICAQITDQLRDLKVKVVQYTKKHNIINIEF